MTAPWLELLDDTIRACAEFDRPDLAQRLRARRASLLGPARRVVVFGCPGQGKSQLVNALLGAAVCAVGDDVTTAVPAVLRHAETPTAAVLGAADAGGPVETATARANKHPEAVGAEIGLPRALLGSGMELVDAPPVGEPTGRRTELAMAALAEADCALLVSDATAALTPLELDLLGQVARLCPAVAVVLTKIDMVPRWRHVAEVDRNRLADAGLVAPVVPVSSVLRLAAAKANDRGLNAESGFTALVECLRAAVLADPAAAAGRAAAATCAVVIEELMGPVKARAAALPPAVSQDGLVKAAKRVEQVQRDAARMQTQLADDVADLNSDVEYDLRDRTRRVLREVDDYFEEADPLKVWPEFSDWMRETLTTVAEANADWLLRRFEWIAGRLAAEVDDLPALLDSAGVDDLRTPRVEPFTPVQKMFVGLRGSYSGLLMSGLATTLAGLPLINPISIGAGVAFGARSVFEERGARLKRRQAVAKTAAQRHVDDFFLAYGKQTRDAVRLIHRALRDRLDEVARQVRADAAESAGRVKRAVEAANARRTELITGVRRDLTKLGTLRGRAEAARRPLTVPRGLTA
ncbi:dynamin family protein [Actinokineospora sp. UTMC 2448]|uniref:dynamin family protein n=1 Tax=Actinokineospora sp. UTMC 2448 TaxID=2268449 RepID=UPI0021644010|nr:dynamin family protein [Actinokineospora sp. UTMC 2448]UVS81604.1 Isoniazid-induced protein IniA [Actinokineospora sp. UTMC 2448]